MRLLLQGIEGMIFDKNKTMWLPVDPAMNKTDFFNKTMMMPDDPAMNKTGFFNKTMMMPADPVINKTQLMPTQLMPTIAKPTKANITAALDPMTLFNTTIGLGLSGRGSTGDNAVGFGNVDAEGFNSVPGVQCATGLTQCNGRATCVNLLSEAGYCGSCTTSCDFYTQVKPAACPKPPPPNSYWRPS